MMITVIGTGYVGLVTGACMAVVGIKVTYVDIDQKKIENLKNGNTMRILEALEQVNNV
jgi:UDPglucose 6-dehydrogenase